MQALAAPGATVAKEVPIAQRLPPLGGSGPSYQALIDKGLSHDEALYRAYVRGHYTITGLARQVGLSISRVSRIVSAFEQTAAGTTSA